MLDEVGDFYFHVLLCLIQANRCRLSTSFPGEPMLFCSWRLSYLQFFSLFENSKSTSTLYQDTPCYFYKFPLCLYVQNVYIYCFWFVVVQRSYPVAGWPAGSFSTLTQLHDQHATDHASFLKELVSNDTERKNCSSFELLIQSCYYWVKNGVKVYCNWSLLDPGNPLFILCLLVFWSVIQELWPS